MAILTMIQAANLDRSKLKPEESATFDQLSLSALENLDPNNKELIDSEFKYLNSRFRSDCREAVREKYARLIQQAEENGDKEQVKKLLLEFSSLIK